MNPIHTANRIVLSLLALLIDGCTTAQTQRAEAAPPTATDDHHSHDKKHGYHHNFSDTEKWIKKFEDPARDKWQQPDKTIEALDIHADDKILDIGAGTGYFSLRIAKAYPQAKIYAADVEPNMIQYLRREGKKRSLANHFPLKVSGKKIKVPVKVNLILVVDTYHHIDDRIAYFSALQKQLLSNGRLAIIDFTPESPEGPPPEHRISKTNLEQEMNEAGYKLDKEITLLPYQYFLIFRPGTDRAK